MDFSEFRARAHAVSDWMADYLESLESRPVRARTRPGEIYAAIADHAPEVGEDFAAVFADFERTILPGITHWQHPRFFAYFPANSSPPSILAEMATAALAVQGMLWETSPSVTELEMRVLEWLARLLDLPAGFQGVIQDSASSATLVALLAARERASGGEASRRGLSGLPPLTVYASSEAHSSVEKAARVAGFGSDQLRKTPVDADQAMDPEALAQLIAEDRARGCRPAAVVACYGATGLGSVDPLGAIAEICAREGLFLHVDAAWAGSALILPEVRSRLEGLEAVDSFVFNPHKWLFTNFDCSALWLRNPSELTRALAIHPAYLASPDGRALPEYRDWSIPLGRRFRALKLWFVLRSYGAEALRARIRAHIAWAEELADRFRDEPDFELAAGPRFALLAFRYAPAGAGPEAVDALTEELLRRVNADGRTYLTRTLLRGRPVIRWSIGQTYTERRHVFEAFDAVREIASALARDAQTA